MLKVIIAGTRDFNDYKLLKSKCNAILSRYLPSVEVVSGTARGADLLGEQYAKEVGLMVKRFPADWDRYGKRAGFLRNSQMAECANCLIAFWDGKSKGTASMIELARGNGLKVRIIYY